MKSMQRVSNLIDAICEVYDNKRYRPRNGKTYCNFAVRYIAEKMGYWKFNRMLANQMIDLMERSPKWRTIKDMRDVQPIANLCELIIAGEKREKHGHVAVVRPGNMEWSNKWGCYCPKVCNIGKNNRLSKGVNWAFKNIPTFYIYLGN